MAHTLLIVDDDPDVRELLRHILTLRGHEVLTAASGSEGLALASQRPITAALVDINMPGMNGLEFCRALHKQEAALARYSPAWIMTGAYRQGMSEAAHAAGAEMVLRKPLKIAELCKRFERAVELYLSKVDRQPVSA